MFLKSSSLLSLAILGHASSQSALGLPAVNSYVQSAYTAPYDDGSFTPVEDLSVVSAGAFTTLRHPMFPTYSVRIQETKLNCDKSKSKAYTGYIDHEGRHIFFYFFTSRNKPSEDDVIFWTNGGPGCSSSVGLFVENGPCQIQENGNLIHNPSSWTANASVFWVDQPIGVGYSYADHGQYVSTTEEAAKDITAFLAIFFKNFSQFKDRPFHMAGESYAGRYLPVFALEVLKQNVSLLERINLKSVVIGNGIVDYFTLYPTYIDVQCMTVSGASHPISNSSLCTGMRRALPLCQQLTLDECIDHFDLKGCRAAREYCDDKLYEPLMRHSDINPYDITKKCRDTDRGNFCYPVVGKLAEYLSLDRTRELFHVDPVVPKPFQTCNDTVFKAFVATLDKYHETYTQVGQLLDRDIRVLVYAGTNDWICNWISNEIWTLEMPWKRQETFRKQNSTDWLIDEKVVGKKRSADGLTYATVIGAGHMVPYDKPEEALVLLQKWLANQPL